MFPFAKNTTPFWYPQSVNFQEKSSYPFGSYPKPQISDLVVLAVPFSIRDILSSVSKGEYRYGFNGKETDSETDLQDYGFRFYNPSYGKFLSVDPLAFKQPEISNYTFAGNTPIWAIDYKGLIKIIVVNTYTDANGKKVNSEKIVYNKLTAEEITGKKFTEVRIAIHTSTVMYKPCGNCSFSFPKEIRNSDPKYLSGVLSTRGEVYAANFIAGVMWDYVNLFPVAKFAEAMLGEDMNTGENLNGFGTASKIIQGAADIFTMGRAGSAVKVFMKDYLGGKLTDMVEDEALNHFTKMINMSDKTEYVKLVYGLTKLGKQHISQDVVYDISKELSKVFDGTKTLSTFYSDVLKKHSINIEIDYLTKDEAIQGEIDKLKEQYPTAAEVKDEK